MHDFASRLICWQRQHGRHGLPWQAADAYRVWLSEIMLQQTQVATVIPYYQRFVASFPTVASLAAASEEQVLQHWSGLGYYARGRNLHAAARLIMEKYQGVFPRGYEQIVELPGVGRSTAAAICALAWHECRAILDGNVKRVLARYCGIEGWPGDKAVEARLWQEAEGLLPPSDIAIYTQALMDMGAMICTRSNPKCGDCIVRSGCAAIQTGRIHELPTPRPNRVLPERHATFLLLMHGSDILLEKRHRSGIWGGLWCPLQLDGGEDFTPEHICSGAGLPRQVGKHQFQPDAKYADLTDKCQVLPPFVRKFTHFKLHITPALLQLARKPKQMHQPDRMWMDLEDALHAAIPAPMRLLLKRLLQNGTC